MTQGHGVDQKPFDLLASSAPEPVDVPEEDARADLFGSSGTFTRAVLLARRLLYESSASTRTTRLAAGSATSPGTSKSTCSRVASSCRYSLPLVPSFATIAMRFTMLRCARSMSAP